MPSVIGFIALWLFIPLSSFACTHQLNRSMLFLTVLAIFGALLTNVFIRTLLRGEGSILTGSSAFLMLGPAALRHGGVPNANGAAFEWLAVIALALLCYRLWIARGVSTDPVPAAHDAEA